MPLAGNHNENSHCQGLEGPPGNREIELQEKLDESRKQIVDYYVPKVIDDPPDAMRGQFPEIGEKEARVWLNNELERTFPKAQNLLHKMQLDVNYKDVTFETLNCS